MNSFGKKCLLPTNIYGRKNTDTSTYGTKKTTINKKHNLFPDINGSKDKKSPLER
jgi:hypothetical protein